MVRAVARHGGSKAMKFPSIAVILLYVTVAASAADHPPVLSDKVNCFSCHANKAAGKSVHSAMSVPCTTCHLVETQDSKTVFLLAMPKEQICFACHEKSTTLKQHTPAITGSCVDCHDSHSSEYPMLLTAQADADYRKYAPKAHSKNGWSQRPAKKLQNAVVAAKTRGSH